MNPRYIAVAVLLFALGGQACAGERAGASAEKPAKAAAAKKDKAPLVDLSEAAREAAKFGPVLRVASKECQCEAYRIVQEKECVAWGPQGQCTNYQYVTREICIREHCHEVPDK